jgi:hypothetical protein
MTGRIRQKGKDIEKISFFFLESFILSIIKSVQCVSFNSLFYLLLFQTDGRFSCRNGVVSFYFFLFYIYTKY